MGFQATVGPPSRSRRHSSESVERTNGGRLADARPGAAPEQAPRQTPRTTRDREGIRGRTLAPRSRRRRGAGRNERDHLAPAAAFEESAERSGGAARSPGAREPRRKRRLLGLGN